MNERRQLGSGPRPATPPPSVGVGEHPEQPYGRRALGPGATTDR
ncbi:hypothetical protein OG906_34085 [Streptomyces sp. NBC_01426]|nr:hypothetical protein [Streptomyces sp. NBC_01426]